MPGAKFPPLFHFFPSSSRILFFFQAVNSRNKSSKPYFLKSVPSFSFVARTSSQATSPLGRRLVLVVRDLVFVLVRLLFIFLLFFIQRRRRGRRSGRWGHYRKHASSWQGSLLGNILRYVFLVLYNTLLVQYGEIYKRYITTGIVPYFYGRDCNAIFSQVL